MKWNGEKQLSTWNANFSFVQFIQERVFRLLVWCRMCAAANVCANGGLRVPMILCTKQQAEADKNYNKKKLRKKHSLLHFVNVYLKKNEACSLIAFIKYIGVDFTREHCNSIECHGILMSSILFFLFLFIHLLFSMIWWWWIDISYPVASIFFLPSSPPFS